MEELVERFQPETVVLETFDSRSSQRSERVRRLCLSVVSLATLQGIDVAVFTRGDVRSAFGSIGAKTRHEIAEAVARGVPALAHRLPEKRKVWNSEDKRMSIFASAALVLTHYHFGANRLFDDLRDAA